MIIETIQGYLLFQKLFYIEILAITKCHFILDLKIGEANRKINEVERKETKVGSYWQKLVQTA